MERNGRAPFPGCKQGLSLSSTVMADNGIGGLKNRCSRTVILFKTNQLCTRKILFKVKDITNIRPTPSIDGLVVIPYHTDIAMGRNVFYQ